MPPLSNFINAIVADLACFRPEMPTRAGDGKIQKLQDFRAGTPLAPEVSEERSPSVGSPRAVV
jgi:hypothetical protein